MLIISKKAVQMFKFESGIRKCSTFLVDEIMSTTECGKMKSWQVHSYGEDLILSTSRIPVITNTNDVLVKLKSASVNPIDNLMKGGYGKTLLQLPRLFHTELPLTLGRDFCGTVVKKGLKVNNSIQIGDEVYGFIPVHKQGSFSEYVVAEDAHIRHRPKFLTPAESTSIVYAAMTAWSALFLTANLDTKHPNETQVLIMGASGGVGTVAIQILKSQNIKVVGTCSTDAIPLVKSLGADEVYDYKQNGYMDEIACKQDKQFDVILDCAKHGPDAIPKELKYRVYVGLNSPLLLNTDQYGLAGGLLKTGFTLANNFINHCIAVRWGFFVPSRSGFEFIDSLVAKQKIRPVIHKEFKFEDLPEALNEVERGHLRGKVVVNFS